MLYKGSWSWLSNCPKTQARGTQRPLGSNRLDTTSQECGFGLLAKDNLEPSRWVWPKFKRRADGLMAGKDPKPPPVSARMGQVREREFLWMAVLVPKRWVLVANTMNKSRPTNRVDRVLGGLFR